MKMAVGLLKFPAFLVAFLRVTRQRRQSPTFRDAIATWVDGAQQVGMEIPNDALDVQVCIV